MQCVFHKQQYPCKHLTCAILLELSRQMHQSYANTVSSNHIPQIIALISNKSTTPMNADTLELSWDASQETEVDTQVSDVERLTQAWISEMHCPEVLFYETSCVSNLLEMIYNQVRFLTSIHSRQNTGRKHQGHERSFHCRKEPCHD